MSISPSSGNGGATPKDMNHAQSFLVPIDKDKVREATREITIPPFYDHPSGRIYRMDSSSSKYFPIAGLSLCNPDAIIIL